MNIIPDILPTFDDHRAAVALVSAGRNGKATLKSDKNPSLTLPIVQPAAVVVVLADVEAVAVSWLWEGRIPMGRVTVLAGRPGIGKSFVTVDAAARVSRGKDWPDGTPCPLGSVLLLAAEDDLADTIRPRLDAAGADCSRVTALQAVRENSREGRTVERCVSLADIDVIHDAVDTMANCRMIIVDPIGSYLGRDADAHRDNEVRAILAPLAKLASDRDIAVVVVAHTRKGGAGVGGGYADDAILGSVAFTGLARSVLHVTTDPDDPTRRRRLLAAGKNNLAPAPATWAWELTDGGLGPAVGWIGPVETTADEAMERGREKPGPDDTEHRRAVDWLRKRLADGPALARDVIDEWENGENGSKRTLDGAKGAAGVLSYRQSIPGKWYWRLSDWVEPTVQSQLPDGPKQQQLSYLCNVAESQGDLQILDEQESNNAKIAELTVVGDAALETPSSTPKKRRVRPRIEPVNAVNDPMACKQVDGLIGVPDENPKRRKKRKAGAS